MGKKPAANWAESEAGKKTNAKSGFGGNDTRLFHGGVANIGGIRPDGPVAPMSGANPNGPRAKGMSIRGGKI
jgi:hypothetical protein